MPGSPCFEISEVGHFLGGRIQRLSPAILRRDIEYVPYIRSSCLEFQKLDLPFRGSGFSQWVNTGAIRQAKNTHLCWHWLVVEIKFLQLWKESSEEGGLFL